MAFDENLGNRIADALSRVQVPYEEKRMFGGLAFMIEGKMCIGVVGNEIMLRVLDEKFDNVLAMPNVREMDFAGRPMKGFVYIAKDGFVSDADLEQWIDLATEFGKLGVVKSKKTKKA